MEKDVLREINQYLVKIFNDISVLEEEALKESTFTDVTIRELHTIEAIGLSGDTTSSQVARTLNITLSTVSTAVQNLVKKDYVERVQSTKDRRVVALKLTKRGKLLYRLHAKFHLQMVERILTDMNDDETQALIKGLRNLDEFLNEIRQESYAKEK